MDPTLKPAILGGPPVRTAPFADRRTMGEAEKAAVLEVLDSDCLSAFIGGPGKFANGGPRVQEFEQAWAERDGFKHAISVSSWTAGLVVACGAVGIQPGDEVIVPPYTMSATSSAPMFYGGIPVFADIDPVTYCLDPASVEARITPRTRAIMVVHLFGRAAPMDELMALAQEHGLKVIEDAAQAPGVYHGDRAVGAIGDVGGFSLNFHKHIHTGEGGMLVTNDDAVAHKCRLIRNHGENIYDAEELDDPINIVGGNYRLTEIQAAIGTAQLARLGGYLETRNHLADHFGARLAMIPGLTPDRPSPDGTHAYYVYPIQYDAEEVGLSRNLFVRAVLAELPPPEGFESTPMAEGYVRPLYLSKIYQRQHGWGAAGQPWSYQPDVTYDYARGLCPVTEDLYENRMLICPLIREPLTLADVDDLAEAMEKVVAAAQHIQETLGGGDEQIMTPVAVASQTEVR